MPPVLLYIVVGIISGAVIGLQGPLASIITHRLGLLESVFIIHLGGTLVALIPLLVFRGGGTLVVVMNHPAYTPSGAGPVIDPTDGEVYWRWGDYTEEGAGDEPAGDGSITFHHRPLGTVLTTAADAGWVLERVVERPATGEALAALIGDQRHIPRLLGVRWRR